MQEADAAKLLAFIEASKSKGASDEFLTAFLVRRGWPQDDVYAALGSYWESATGLAIPERTAGGESSRDAFLYLLSFSTLAAWSGALGSMLFAFIERWIPDPVATHRSYYNLRTSVTWQMASIAVSFPIFLFVMRTILREAEKHPERLQSGVRRWLTYIALLATAGTMICDLIWFLDYFLTGELTARFVLKALTIMAICGAIFLYYLSSLRWNRTTDVGEIKSRSRKFGIAATAAVVICFSIGMSVAGTPGRQRAVESDRRRVQDLRAIAYAVAGWHQRAKVADSTPPLPPDLAALAGKGINVSQSADPETRAPYEYQVQSGRTYTLCATFTAEEESDAVTQFWHHAAGRTCISLDAEHTNLY